MMVRSLSFRHHEYRVLLEPSYAATYSFPWERGIEASLSGFSVRVSWYTCTPEFFSKGIN